MEILEKNAPPGYKYCFTLVARVPRERDSVEKVLKNPMETKKVKPSTNTSNPEEPKTLDIYAWCCCFKYWISRKDFKNKRSWSVETKDLQIENRVSR